MDAFSGGAARAATIRLDALVAKHLHLQRLAPLSMRCRFLDFLALAVPTSYLPVRLISKGSTWFGPVEVIWEILAALLLVTATAKIVFGWSERAAVSRSLMERNADVAAAAAGLLDGTSRIGLAALVERAAQLDKEDDAALERVKDPQRRAAYRAALIEFDAGGAETVCPVCSASPYRFRPGACQTCGNTPIRSASTTAGQGV